VKWRCQQWNSAQVGESARESCQGTDGSLADGIVGLTRLEVVEFDGAGCLERGAQFNGKTGWVRFQIEVVDADPRESHTVELAAIDAELDRLEENTQVMEDRRHDARAAGCDDEVYDG
jgi:hypothetical protein